MSLTCTPSLSGYARYFPSGEMLPPSTQFSLELLVSCRYLISGRAAEDCGWRLANHKAALTTIPTATMPTATPRHQERGPALGSIGCARAARSECISDAD